MASTARTYALGQIQLDTLIFAAGDRAATAKSDSEGAPQRVVCGELQFLADRPQARGLSRKTRARMIGLTTVVTIDMKTIDEKRFLTTDLRRAGRSEKARCMLRQGLE